MTTIVCGLLSLTYVFSVIKAGGVGKNGSTVAVSPNHTTHYTLHTNTTLTHTQHTQNKNYFGSSKKKHKKIWENSI